MAGARPDALFDHDRIREGVRLILEGLGLDPADQRLVDTPARVARMLDEICAGLLIKPADVLDVVFEEGHDEIVLVRDIPFASLCLPSRQTVNALTGAKPARDVAVGDRLWTFDADGRLASTEVISVRSRKSADVIKLRVGGTSLQLTPEHPVLTPVGWREAGSLAAGDEVRWINARRLRMGRYPVNEGHDLGYVIGAVGSDGSVQDGRRRALSQVAVRRASSNVATPSACLPKTGRSVVAAADGSRAPRPPSHDHFVQPALSRRAPGWYGKPGFQPIDEPLLPPDGEWTPLTSVERLSVTGTKPYTVYSFQCRPHPTFLVGGVQTHNCEHHLIPFVGKAHVGYLPNVAGQVTGLSKLARLVDVVAKRPNLQERITAEVADTLEQVLQPRGVLVMIEAEHLCMTMRGVRKPGAVTVTSAVRGRMREDPRTRAEAMALVFGHRGGVFGA